MKKNTTVELNEFGNVSKVEMTHILSETQGTLEQTFYYRIEKEAGLSTDDETGEQFPVYCHIKIHHENEMSEDTLDYAHKIHYPLQLSAEHGMDVAHITPISKEEYEQEMN